MCLNPVDVKRWCGFEEKSDDKTLKRTQSNISAINNPQHFCL